MHYICPSQNLEVWKFGSEGWSLLVSPNGTAKARILPRRSEGARERFIAHPLQFASPFSGKPPFTSTIKNSWVSGDTTHWMENVTACYLANYYVGMLSPTWAEMTAAENRGETVRCGLLYGRKLCECDYIFVMTNSIFRFGKLMNQIVRKIN